MTGAALAGCTDGSTAEELSAEQMLDDANDTMSELKSVTVEAVTVKAAGDRYSSRVTTDLASRCTSKTTWPNGAVLEQIRIGETDYVRPNRTYIDKWKGRATADGKKQDIWSKVPTSRATPGDGLVACPREFASFGTAKKGETTTVDGSPAIEVVVTDKADKGGTYTFYVATEGRPYILKTVYKGADLDTTTTFSAFDEPLAVRPPAKVIG
ncbi:hypothetical protein [Streptomyces sp. GESEQ-35]|uniref:hypothetical protein n=1 Tax=Streptomyces sp. GESEQ-35 TaxID=2812657 RepID=UPI0027E2B95B|nr:hypothetical protein [Streptomyces sp. GESEQ-35]